MLYIYQLYDGIDWHPLAQSPTQLEAVEALKMAEERTKNWHFQGVAQALDLYFFVEGEIKEPTYIGQIVTKGRYYRCGACLRVFPHPVSEIPICQCGRRATYDDLLG